MPLAPFIRMKTTSVAIALTVVLTLLFSLFGGLAMAETTTTISGAVTGAPQGTAAEGTSTAPVISAAGIVAKPAEAEVLNPGITFEKIDVQVWPEYDQASVLVLVDVVLPEDTKFPFKLRYAVPKGAQVHGTAEISPNGEFTHGPPAQFDYSAPDRDIVNADILKSRNLRLEWYYDPGLNLTGQRDFGVLFELPGDTEQVSLSIQEPARSSGFAVSPALSQSNSQDGLQYVGQTLGPLKGGDQLQYRVGYSKPDGKPSVDPQTDEAPGSSTNKDLLLIILVTVIVGIGGFAAYRKLRPQPAAYSRGGGRRPAPSRQRAVTGSRPTSRGGGSRRAAGSVARFCTACGEELTPTGRFCAVCGVGRT